MMVTLQNFLDIEVGYQAMSSIVGWMRECIHIEVVRV